MIKNVSNFLNNFSFPILNSYTRSKATAAWVITFAVSCISLVATVKIFSVYGKNFRVIEKLNEAQRKITSFFYSKYNKQSPSTIPKQTVAPKIAPEISSLDTSFQIRENNLPQKSTPPSKNQLENCQTIEINAPKIVLEIPSLDTSSQIRENNLSQKFTSLLKKWLTVGNRVPRILEETVAKINDAHKVVILNWLTQLEQTTEFKNKQKELFRFTGAILNRMLTTESFRNIFIVNIEKFTVHQEISEENTIRNLNKIYTSWILHAASDYSIAERVGVLKKAAETYALRYILERDIGKENVKALIYYEGKLKNSLNLLSIIEREENFSDIPELSLAILEDEVKKNYLSFLIEMPAFQAVSQIESLDFHHKLEQWSTNLDDIPFECLTNLVELKLSHNNLSRIPSKLANLIKLKTLVLNQNALAEVSFDLGNLQALITLDISHNKLTYLPGDLGKLQALTTLDISHNKLTHLPEELRKLQALITLDISHNKLTHLPKQLSSLRDLETLNLSKNPDLKELPESLGEIISLTDINIEGTQITQNQKESILELCRQRREASRQSPNSVIQKWAKLNKVSLDEEKFIQLEVYQRMEIETFLLRLETIEDFRKNSKKICEIVCNILQTALTDEIFLDIFVAQLVANNTRCDDRTAAAFSEIYTAWQIYISPNMSEDQQLELLTRAAKTNALRTIVSEIFFKGRESAEVFLYCEKHLKDKLKLLTIIEEIGNEYTGEAHFRSKRGLTLDCIKIKVEDTYFSLLINIPALQTLVEKNADFQKLWKPFEETFYLQIEKLEEDSQKNIINENSYLEGVNAVAKEKEKSRNEKIYDWLQAKI